MFAVFKGWLGETTVRAGLWFWLDGKVYRRFHNLVIPSQGRTTQIDHVIVSPCGIFVIETKNMKGWIFGDEQSRQWTQIVFRRKTRFQNPLHQNFGHVKALAEFLNFPDFAFHSLVFFIGDSTFKTPMPPNVLMSGLSTHIKSVRGEILTPEQVEYACARLKEVKINPSASRREHVEGLKRRI